MSHDFLTSMHSSVTKTEREAPEKKPTGLEKRGRGRPVKIVDGTRHRTVGVSMSPQLQVRADTRARALGLPFSRYVQWCVEAELDGTSLSERFKV